LIAGSAWQTKTTGLQTQKYGKKTNSYSNHKNMSSC